MKIESIVLNRLKELDRTQTWLAMRLGVTRQQVSQFLKGKSGMSMGKFTKMLGLLGLEIRPKK